jgi:O-antigen ligase/Flp pilus assembly protein TadD
VNALSKARLAPETNLLLAFLCLALLVLPFHPFWLDFEQVRRGLLAVILGLIAVLLPGRFASLQLPTRLLLCGILWLLLPALASTSSLARQWESLSYLAALVLLTMLSPSVPRATWAVSLPAVILLTSIYGIAQRMGIAEFAGYGAVGEPVSVFGNLNVAAEVTCVGLAACLVLGIERPRWSIAALVIGGAYLPIDGSRSSLVALPLAAAWFLFAVTAARMRKLTLLCALLVGAGCGFAIDAIGPAPFRDVEPAAQEQVANKQTATLAVRSEIRASCIAMIKDAPFFGRGLSGFAIDYPLYRSQHEIELSSFDRQFSACPQTAHNDYLQIAVEGGVPALLFWLAAAIALLRCSWSDRAQLVPFAALLGLMAVRAPLWNAPCAALAFMFAFAPSDTPAVLPCGFFTRCMLRCFGVALLFCGLQPILTNQDAADYQASRANKTTPDIKALERAQSHAFAQPKIEQLLIQEWLSLAGQPARTTPNNYAKTDALTAAERALAARPNDPSLHRLHAEVLVARGDLTSAKAALKRATALDPGDPGLLLQIAELAFLQNDHDLVVRILYQEPHWRLREKLAGIFDDFARLSHDKNAATAELRYHAEAALYCALAVVGGGNEWLAKRNVQPQFAAAKQACIAAKLQNDPRMLALIALLALDAEVPKEADRAAEILHDSVLLAWQITAIGAPAKRLRALSSWRPLFPQ